MNPYNSLVMSGFPAQTSSVSLLQWSQKMVRSSWQVTVSSGTINGSFTVQVSNDQSTDGQSQSFYPSNWSTVGSVGVVCSSSAPGAQTYLIPALELSYEYSRLLFTTGTNGAALGIYSVRQKSMGL